MANTRNPESAVPGSQGGSDGEPFKAPSSARERTVHHMRKLLAKAALAGGAAHLAGCDGPVVCDPLPPPVNCAAGLTGNEIADSLTVQARWKQEAGGLAVVVNLYLFASNATFSAVQVNEGATPLDAQVAATAARLSCRPLSGATSVTASVSITCDDGVTATVPLALDVSGTPQAEASIPCTVGN